MEYKIVSTEALDKLHDIVHTCCTAQAFIALQGKRVTKIALWFGNKMTITVVTRGNHLHNFTTEEDMDIMDDVVDETIRSIDLTLRTADIISSLRVYGWEITGTDLDKMLRKAIWLSSNE